VKAHDPVAMGRAKRENADLGIVFCESPAAVAADANALVLVTDWPAYLELPWAEIAKGMRHAFVVDARNCLDRAGLAGCGLRCVGIGR
jgi:UDPglucose 6-dehydrogenase